MLANKQNKVRKNLEFRNVYRRGKSFSNNLLVLYIYNNRRNIDDKSNRFNRLGISVSKKVGKSVIRSKVKRIINESFRLNADKVSKGYDLVFVARVSSKDKSYWEIEKSMINLFKKAGL